MNHYRNFDPHPITEKEMEMEYADKYPYGECLTDECHEPADRYGHCDACVEEMVTLAEMRADG